MPRSASFTFATSKNQTSKRVIPLNESAFDAVQRMVKRSDGANSVIHTAGLIELSTDLPVVIEVVEDQAHVDRLLPILDEMITGGALVTVEQVRVLRYAAGPNRVPGV
jgi:hypothetical protein